MSPLKKIGGPHCGLFFNKSREHCRSTCVKYKAQHRDHKNYKAMKVSPSVPVCPVSTLPFHLSPDIPERMDPAGIK